MTHIIAVVSSAVAFLLPLTVGGEIPPEYREGPHRVQGLDALMERQGEKPYGLYFREDGALATNRVIFRDQQFGTEIWMIDDSPVVEHAGTASIWPAWNINASALFIEGTRPTATGAHQGWFCDAGFSRLWPAQGGRPAVWAPEDPQWYYAPASPTANVTRTNWRTGQRVVVAEWEPLSWPASGKRIYGLTRDARHIFIDLICLATDDAFIPSGPRPERQAPPRAVETLVAENIRDRVNSLRWDASQTPSLSHYQVYAAREPFDQPAQQHLIGSPTVPEFIDWGLRADTTYHYAVTAVDRRGQESEPVFATAKTPARKTEPSMIELAFADAEREGDFEVSEASGLRGPAYVVPRPRNAHRVAWKMDIPQSGKHYFWLRYLQRGSEARGDQVRQQVRVALDGQFLTTLGGQTDLHVPDTLIDKQYPLAPRLWTWAWPGEYNLEGVELPAGQYTLTLDNFFMSRSATMFC